MRPSGTTRGVRAASAPSMTPSSVTTPARNSSATTSMIPEPQIPVMPVSATAAAKSGLVRPGVDADDPEARLERVAVDADALDGAGRGALATADLGALEGRAGRARRGEQPALVAEHDLGVRADVDDEGHAVGLVRLLGEDDAGRVGPDVAGDARQHVDPGARDGRAGRARAPWSARRGRWPARTARRRAASGRCRAAGGA